MILAEIKQDVFRRLNKPNPPDEQTEARITSFINDRHRMLMTQPGLDELRRDTLEVQSFIDYPVIPLPGIVNRIDAMIDQSNNRRLMEKSLDWLRTVDPRYSSGTPTVYIARGYRSSYAVLRTNDVSELWVSSSSPADVGIIRVEGDDYRI